MSLGEITLQSVLIIRDEGIVAIYSKADVAMMMGKLGTSPVVTKAVLQRLSCTLLMLSNACGAHFKIGDNIDVIIKEVLIGKDKLIAAFATCDGIGSQTW